MTNNQPNDPNATQTNAEKRKSSPPATPSSTSLDDHATVHDAVHDPPLDHNDGQYYSFFSPEISTARKAYFSLIAKIITLTIILMWAFLPLYWGSLATSNKHTRNLTAWVVDRDNSTIGNGVSNFIKQSLTPPSTLNLGWEFVEPTELDVVDDESVERSVVQEKAWVILVINSNATSNLLSARLSSSASYNPTSAISVYYAQARNELASNNYIVPILNGLLLEASTQIGAELTTSLWSQFGGNTTLLQKTLIDAPETISNPVGWTMINLRPYTAPVATALTLVGEIYLCIFAFVLTMANFTARHQFLLHQKLTLKSLLWLRLAVPMILYIPLSLSFATISLPFKLPFGARYTYAQGFFLYFAICYLMMSALGLATESMITLLGSKFVAFFLLALIISNVSVASLPTALQPGIYKYGRGWPMFNASQAIRHVIFNTKSHLGLNFGVIVAWVALSMFTVTILQYWLFEGSGDKGRGRRLKRMSN